MIDNKPRIAIVATGGTIASTAADKTQLADYKVSAGVSDLVAAVPALESLADFEFEQICNIESHGIDDAVLMRIAQAVQRFCDRSDIDGVVITHGTDTLEETAFFLHLTVDTTKPIVLVGAMRPGSAVSADGPLNLFHAVAVAGNPTSHGRGVLVVMNDRIASARHVTKGHANGVDAFVPTEFGYLGLVFGRWVQYHSRVELPHTANSDFKRAFEQGNLPPVDVIYDHQGADTHHYRASIGCAKGIVLAATGQGSLSPQAKQGAEMARDAGVVIVRSTRVWQGVVRSSEKDDRFGTVAGYTLNPAKARILLRLALRSTDDLSQIRAWFTRY
ncbi:type II asparaginase [Orrella daihaiensis]|uniref:Type II asparaginase n=1 Tax=Orrella daihaiensis TaxID=2782176 RepID=A0ABY4ASL9_9BURK|nr:type II asparaginase [Orrella daihaiensis]UOD51034.1 type II asparaginase [Orrella daihaiensis]